MTYTTLFTNDKRPNTSKKFLKEFESKLDSTDNLLIASGYIGTTTIEDLETRLKKVAAKGTCKILIGMVYHGGVTKKQHIALTSLDKKLRATSKDNGIYISRQPYHGKIYSFLKDDTPTVYLGSSNFSKEGFLTRFEATALLRDEETVKETNDYLNYLFKLNTTAKLEDVELRINGSKKVKVTPSKDLDDYEIEKSDFPDRSNIIGVCDIKLRVDKQPASSLNLYFDQGRYNKATKKYAPRPWYEIEIGSSVKEIKSKYYPESTLKETGTNSREGSFEAYFQDNKRYYKINMVVSSSNGKNIFSSGLSGGRETLGRVIKGKLERAGVLKEGDLITSDILDAYGNDILKLSKINSNTYIMDF